MGVTCTLYFLVIWWGWWQHRSVSAFGLLQRCAGWHHFRESYTLRHVLFWISSHMTPALQELHWLPVADRIQFKLCLLEHKSLFEHMSEYILDLLTSVASVPAWSALHALSSGSLVVPQTHLRISDRAFSVATPWAWNRLPTQLKLLLQSTTTRRRGVVVSGVRRMNEVNARRARFVPGWVTVFGRVYHLGM